MALGKNLQKHTTTSKSENGKATKERAADQDYGSVDFLQVMEGSVLSIVMIDEKGTISYFNSSAEKLWGYDRGEVIGKNVKMLTPKDIQPKHDGFIKNYNDTGKRNVMGGSRDVKALTKDGKEVDIFLSLSETETDGVVSYTAFIQDISEQKRLQSELQTRMDQVNVACIVSESDLKGNIISVNDKLCEVSQYSREECIGQPHSMFRHPDMPKETFKELWSTIGRGQIFRGVIKNRKKDGSPYWVDAIIAPVMGPNGKPEKYIGIRYDITDMKVKEEELQSSMEEMSAQEEEIRQNMEELTATQEEMERKQLEMTGTMNAINSTSAFIEFDIDGNVIAANDLFLDTVKYSIEEIEGKHHSIFCDPTYAKSREYQNFWNELRAGKSQTGEFQRKSKDGNDVWLLASYTPVLNGQGEVAKFIKLAQDITKTKTKNADYQGQLEAIGKSQAVIEFNLDGTIISANDNFLKTLGYSLSEVEGKHHSIFVTDDYKRSTEYKSFWDKLNRGEYESGEFMRITKTGEEVWIQASYNPIMDLNGNPFKVVKYGTDITAEKLRNSDFQGQMEAVSKSYGVIEFDLDGTIRTANQNFLDVVGYPLNQVQGKHHSMFVDAEIAKSVEYRQHWEKLNNGQFVGGTFSRLNSAGQEVFIQATYNPIMDVNGKPFKVVKYATDITEFTRALKAVSHFVGELRDGNFDADIEVRAQGDVGKMIEDNLALKATISEILSEVNEVVKKAGEEGDLNARLNNTGKQGTWKQLVDSVNILLQSIAEPVLEFNTIITEMSKGDLSKRFEMKTNGDLKNMADSLNLAINNLNALLGSISENVNIVSQSAANTLSKSESMKSNTDEMASAISQMAKGAQDQAQKTDESSKLAEQVLESADDMESKSDVIYKAAEKGVSSCENGLKIIKKLVENMDGINSSAGLTNESIKILTTRAEEIGRTLNVITDIAAQTNLLALNAAIEAARAGEAGRGFAVVAEEIRKLAEDSRKSAVDIEKIIGDVQKDTQSASKAIETMTVSVKDGSSATKDAELIFEEIAESSEETLQFSGAIKEATVKQKVSVETVAKNIEQIVVVAEETAAGTEEIATSSQELNNGMQEVAVSSNQLTKIATDLKNDISKFKLQ